MCGLIGALVSADFQISDKLDRGLGSLHHRGPDHQERRRFRVAGRDLWLGFTRLSIIDLSNDANQPMCSDDGRYALIFNGEIYNYIELRSELQKQGVVFRTVSDTEVLLKAWMYWGNTCLTKLEGMFAFVILDTRDATLTCVRDPFGIKPLFYGTQDGALFLASEMPTILGLLPTRPGPDLQRAYDYLVHGDYDSDEHTFVDGVRHLMPGHIMSWDIASGTLKSLCRWWSPNIEQASRLSFKDAAEAVRELFLENMRRQLRSDVPLGAALSGGIDSSAVVCAMRQLEPDLPIHTFSFVTPGSAVSEERWVDIVNQHVSATPHKVFVGAKNLVSDIDDVVRVQGEPFGSTSIYAQYRVFKLARESGITVTLDGQGADELLAGYNGFPGLRARSLMEVGHVAEAVRFVMRWGKWRSAGRRRIAAALARAMVPDKVYESLRRMDGHTARPVWLDTELLRESSVRFIWPRSPRARTARGRRLIEFLAGSLQAAGLPSLLRHGDRNAMAFSIESRVPFLTPQLCRLLYSLPEDYLLSAQGETKHIFRAAMRGIVPDDILDRRDKIGFATPEHEWFRDQIPLYRGWIEAASGIPFLDHRKLLAAFESMASGTTRYSWQAWRWVNYARWWVTVFHGCASDCPASLRR